VVTVEMKTSFMRPAEGELRAVGKLLHRTTTLAFCEGHVHNHRGEICAHASGTFKYLRGLPVDGRRIKPLPRRQPRTPEPPEDTA
jgi:acyl-coenzyme A thioesterase PaaI-like protein